MRMFGRCSVAPIRPVSEQSTGKKPEESAQQIFGSSQSPFRIDSGCQRELAGFWHADQGNSGHPWPKRARQRATVHGRALPGNEHGVGQSLAFGPTVAVPA